MFASVFSKLHWVQTLKNVPAKRTENRRQKESNCSKWLVSHMARFARLFSQKTLQKLWKRHCIIRSKKSFEEGVHLDEVLTGALSEEDEGAKQKPAGLTSTLKWGQLYLREWTCKNLYINVSIPSGFWAANELLEIRGTDCKIKRLRIVLSPCTESFDLASIKNLWIEEKFWATWRLFSPTVSKLKTHTSIAFVVQFWLDKSLT